MILSDIFIYPVKSLAGIRVSCWNVVDTGLKYDRQWMLIDDAGNFLSQRRLPKMALIQPHLTDSELILSADNVPDFHLSLDIKTEKIIQSSIWKDFCEAQHVSNDVDAWLEYVLEIPCKLVYLPTEVKRHVDQCYATPDDYVAFADGFPFLIIAENSLNALNLELENPIEMTRFRPNLVIAGCESYAEDVWREIQIGNMGFRLPKPCSRCLVPSINPKTIEITKEPLATLNRLRKWQNKIYFGQNAIHDHGGQLEVGQEVTVKKIGAKQPPI